MRKSPIRIGVVLPITGGEKIFGTQGIQGVTMAVAEINRAGGVLGGRKLELVIEDTKTDVQTAVEKTHTLILKEKVKAIIGPVTSAARDEMVKVATQYKIPLLYGTDYEGGACYRYLFCYSPIPEHYINPLLPHLLNHFGKAFYLLGTHYIWPLKINEFIKERLPSLGGSVVGEEYTDFMTIEGISDFRPYIARIADSGANVGILTLLGADAQRFLRQFSELGLNKSVKLAVMAFCESFLPGLNKDEVEGVITCVPFLESLDRPETRDFVERQKRMFGPETVVSYFAESHYGLVMFLKNAIEKAQSDHMKMVIDQMGDQTLTVANGEVTLRASDHHMVLNMVIAEVRGGKLMAKEYIGPVAPSNQCSGKKERK